jgi:tape measure domain-containing protein
MADNTLREAIRIVLETEGREGVDELRKALAGVGDVSAATVSDTDRLLESITGLNEAAAKATRFAAMSAELEKTTTALDDASRAALQLNLQLAETEKPSKEMLRTYQQVREEVTRLERTQTEQAAAVAKVSGELQAQGVDTSSLANANKQLRAQIEGATAALTKQAGVIEREAAATAAHKSAIAEQDAAFRKMAQSGHVSADALAAYRQRALEAAAGTKALSGEGGRLSGMFSGLRGLIAPVLGFLTLSTAAEGIKNLLGVSAAAENAKRSLGNLYGSQEEGNRVYKELRQLAKDNGQAFANVLEDAKKLKAFGLDPLTGSYQALVDQNAAVGGSAEDLSGKVLALGQAWAKQKLQGEEILQLVERGVPVWDLLQRATGKNVTELQNLSSAGKLGRDVIVKLYQEIENANAGAAGRSLGGLTGLLSQVTARWQDFLTKVADAGVTDYFKQQIQSLLGSTGSLDDLARRVAAGIISTLDALKRLGREVATIVSPIANATLALARHADAVVFLGKVYLALRLSRFTREMLDLAKAQQIATAATEAATAAEAARGVGVGKLGGLLGSLPKTIQIGLLVAGLDYTLNSFIKLNAALDYRKEVLQQIGAFDRAQRELSQEQLVLGQRLQDVYKASADTIIKSAGQINGLTREQGAAYQFALEQARQYYGGVIREARSTGDAQKEAAATEHWKALGVALDEVKKHLGDLDAAARDVAGFKALANAAVDNFDAVVKKTRDVKQAVSDIFLGIDFTSLDGMKQALAIIDGVGARGKAAGLAIKTELREALSKVAATDLPALKAAADDAFGTGTAGAKMFAAEVDRINLTRLGVDVDAIKTGFTQTGRAAVDSFRGAIAEIDKLGLTTEQRSKAIAQAFDNAFKQAGTKAEVEALKKALQEALTTGNIGFAEFQQRMTAVDAKLQELSGSGKAMGDTIAAAAGTAGNALDGMATSAASAASETQRVGEAAKEAGDAAEEGSRGIQASTEAMISMSTEAARALVAQNRLAAFQDVWRKNVNQVMGDLGRQRDEVAAVNAQLDEQLAALDPLTAKVAALKQQYNYVDDETLRALAQKQQQLEDQQKRAEEATQKSEQAQRSLQDQQASASPGPARANGSGASPALPSAPPAISTRSSGAVLATLRVQVVGGGTFDLEVDPTSARGLIDELTRAQQIAQKR